ncbi:hypothetical protein [Solemya pervernicosa gill symbiont]|nr:hypothetical protein [Solemya pervernicosa gill symbiont]
MDDRLQELLQDIQQLEDQLLLELQKKKEEFLYEVEEKRVLFDREIRKQHRRLSTGLFRYLSQSKPKHIRGVAIFARVCFGHPSPSKQQKLHATVYAYGAPTLSMAVSA